MKLPLNSGTTLKSITDMTYYTIDVISLIKQLYNSISKIPDSLYFVFSINVYAYVVHSLVCKVLSLRLLARMFTYECTTITFLNLFCINLHY